MIPRIHSPTIYISIELTFSEKRLEASFETSSFKKRTGFAIFMQAGRYSTRLNCYKISTDAIYDWIVNSNAFIVGYSVIKDYSTTTKTQRKAYAMTAISLYNTVPLRRVSYAHHVCFVRRKAHVYVMTENVTVCKRRIKDPLSSEKFKAINFHLQQQQTQGSASA